jgi:pyruvate,water dikinase
MLTNFQPIFAEHIYVTFLAPIPVGAIGQICAALDRPTDTMKVISGVGDVQSAAPAMALWELGRLVANEPALMAAFDAGPDGALERVRESGSVGEPFLAGFDDFIDKFGCRGPNEWEMRVHTWETRPVLALAAIDRMRLSGDDAAPAARNAAMAADRERVVAEISEALAGDAETLGAFQAATKAAAIFNAGRERTKTNCVKFIHEARMAMHTIGRRMVADGHCDDSGDFSLLFLDQIEDWFENPASYRDTIRERKSLFDEYMGLQEPFVFDAILSDPNTWSSRADFQVEPVAVGDVLDGISGCPGSATGIARVITDPADPTALGPGEVLVAPSTDPSWTPLFVPAAAVIVDVGSPVSHAIIVSRELGIPCVPSVTNASRRIPDGATVEVNGDTGQVTILALP